MNTARWAYDNDFSTEVILAPRHAKEVVGESSQNLKQILDADQIKNVVIDDIESPEALKTIGNTEKSICLSINAAWIFKRRMINDVFGGRLLNLHEARLPFGRGGGGISWKILSGDRLGASVLHLVTPKIDAGGIVMTQDYIYPPAECRLPVDYYRYTDQQSCALIREFLTKARAGDSFETFKQPSYLSTYWPRLHTKTHAWIDWSWPPAEMERFICAFDEPFPGAQTMIYGKPVNLKNAVCHYDDGPFHPFQSGLIYRKTKGWLCIALAGASLLVQSVTDEDGHDILPEVKEGDRFYTPAENLRYNARRVQFSAAGFQDITHDI